MGPQIVVVPLRDGGPPAIVQTHLELPRFTIAAAAIRVALDGIAGETAGDCAGHRRRRPPVAAADRAVEHATDDRAEHGTAAAGVVFAHVHATDFADHAAMAAVVGRTALVVAIVVVARARRRGDAAGQQQAGKRRRGDH